MAVNVKTEPPGIFSCINVNVMDDDKEKSFQMRRSMIKREGVDPKFRKELKVDVGAGNFQNVSCYVSFISHNVRINYLIIIDLLNKNIEGAFSFVYFLTGMLF